MAFGDVYREFIETAGEVARRKIDRDPALRALSTIVDDTIKALTSDNAVSAVHRAFDMEDQLVRDLLQRELQFITDQQKRKHTAGEDGDTDPVATGKESLEELLDKWLPDWLKKLLKILNEILKLVGK